MMKQKHIVNFIMLSAGFLLFWEWLRPLEVVADIEGSHVFVVFTVLCFLTSFFIKNWIGKFLIKLIVLVLALDYLFFDTSILSGPWLQQLQMELSYNFDVVWDNEWALMTSFFRSMLFLIVLWLMSYLLHYWFTVANRFLLFVVLTILYLAVLDTFTSYDAQMAMIRTFIISFVVLGLSRYLKLMADSEQKSDQKDFLQWMLLVVGIVSFATVAGIYSPKLEPQWPDPVPFLQSNSDHLGFGTGGSMQQVGYGEDDSQLGGSFLQDESPVFDAIAHDNVYWRIESKDVYTGKGWENSADFDYELIEDGQVDFETFFMNQVETERHTAVVQPDVNNPLPRMVYPYDIAQVNSNNAEAFFIDRNYGVLESEAAEQNQHGNYTIDYEAPSFSINELQENSVFDPSEIQEQYLQLPDDLPDRVSELAAEITAEHDNRYDQAKAVERYFAANGFTYQTTDVPVPTGDEDYVDQFLFETQYGYCDNYSTAMVVMLRSQDIPARWVKGFTGGTAAQEQPDLPDNYSLYQVKNENAHSWVEVYFPETGWVPFEPTSGFTNPSDFYYEATDPGQTEQDVTEETDTDSEQEDQDVEEEEETEEEETEQNPFLGGNNDQEGFNNWGYVWLVVLILLVITGIIAYLKRQKIQNWYAMRKWNKLLRNLEIEKAYLFLLKSLEKRGYPRKKGQSLREYAKQVDEELEMTEMKEITAVYEEYLYHNQTIETASQKRLQKLFRKVGNQIFT